MSLYTENEEKWKQLIDIDYFTHFVKAWVTFNAWYKNHFPDATSDRDAIHTIQEQSNSIKHRFKGYLTGEDENSKIFRQNLGHLKYTLTNQNIENKGKRIYFESFALTVDRTQLKQEDKKRNIDYLVEVKLRRSEVHEVIAKVTKSDGTILLDYTHTNYDENDLRAFADFTNKLSQAQQEYIIGCFKRATPHQDIQILTTDSRDSIDMVSCKFKNDPELIFKLTIEILYNLRNVLFHGQIVPDKQTNKVYEPAYKVLKMLLD